MRKQDPRIIRVEMQDGTFQEFIDADSDHPEDWGIDDFEPVYPPGNI